MAPGVGRSAPLVAFSISSSLWLSERNPLFLWGHMDDGRPATRRLPRLHRRIIPTDIVIDVVTVLAKEIELEHALLLLCQSLVGRRFERIHELEELLISPVLIAYMFAAGTVATFTAHIFQVGRVLFVSITGGVLKSDDVTLNAFPVELAQRRPLGVHQRLECLSMLGVLPHLKSKGMAFLTRFRTHVFGVGELELNGMFGLGVHLEVRGSSIPLLDFPGIIFHQREDGII